MTRCDLPVVLVGGPELLELRPYRFRISIRQSVCGRFERLAANLDDGSGIGVEVVGPPRVVPKFVATTTGPCSVSMQNNGTTRGFPDRRPLVVTKHKGKSTPIFDGANGVFLRRMSSGISTRARTQREPRSA